MTITLPDDLAQQLQRWVTSGGYADPIAAIRDAFELLLAQDEFILERRDQILAAIEESDEQIARGEYSVTSAKKILEEVRAKRATELLEQT